LDTVKCESEKNELTDEVSAGSVTWHRPDPRNSTSFREADADASADEDANSEGSEQTVRQPTPED